VKEPGLADDSSTPLNNKIQGLIASPLHTLLVAGIWAANTYLAAMRAGQSRAGLGPSRTAIYLRTMVFELVMLGVVAFGVWLRGMSLQTIFGQRWRSTLQMFRDLGLGVLLWIAATVVTSLLGGHQSGDSANREVAFLLPQTSREMLLWILLSITAGICEEAIYRGYFQRQFSGLTRSVPAGIILSAGMFGAAHAYQGMSRALVIVVSGLLYGAFAEWRRTVRPGMFGHTIQDAIAPALLRLTGH